MHGMGKPVGPCRFEAERRLFGPEDDPCPAWSTCHVSVKQQHAVTTYSFQCKYKYCETATSERPAAAQSCRETSKHLVHSFAWFCEIMLPAELSLRVVVEVHTLGAARERRAGNSPSMLAAETQGRGLPMVFSLGCPLLCGIGSLRSEIQEFAVKRIALQKQFRLQRDADRDLGKSITPTVCHMFSTFVAVRKAYRQSKSAGGCKWQKSSDSPTDL